MGLDKEVLFVFATSLFFVFVLSLVLAVQPDKVIAGKNMTGFNETVKEAKNMTFGQCVSQNAVIKNDCYSSVKGVYSSCKNSTSDVKACGKAYKVDKAQCKKEFKLAKNECKKIKHNFFETTRYAFA